MKNMVKFWGIIAFSAVIVFSMIGCGEDDSNEKNNQTGDDSINFSDAKWSNIDVYKGISGVLYNGSNVTFTTVDGYTFSEVSSNPSAWNIKIENNKLSIVLGIPDKVSLSANFFPEGVNPDGLKVVVYQQFEDDNGNILISTDPDSNINNWVLFAYTDKAGIVSGSAEKGGSMMSYNLNLKAGWNTIIYKEDNNTRTGSITTGVPGSNYKWCFFADEDGDDGSIDFTDAKWSNIDVLKHTFDEANQVSTFTPYNGSNKIFTKVILDSMDPESFSEISSNPSEWNIKIENNKLSISLGIPDLAAHFEDIHDSVNPDGLKVVINRFFRDDKDKTLALIDPASDSTSIWFAHADKAGIISGIYNYTDSYNNNITYNYNLNLKAGWNTVIFTQDNATITATMTTGVPSSNFKWVYYGDEGGDDGDDGSIDFSDAKWRDIDVYSDESAPYNGSNKTFTKVGDPAGNTVPFSEVSSNSDAWNIKIENNKLSIVLGTPNLAEHSSVIPDSINPDDLKVVFYQTFQDDNGSTIHLSNYDDDIKYIFFVYADKAGIISGDDTFINFNLNLKAGWNTAIYMMDNSTSTYTLTTGVPSSDLKWYFSGD